MKTGLYLTSDWSLSRLAEYGPEITSALKKLLAEFPRDGTLESIRDDIVSGGIQLWLMFEDEAFKGVVLTDLKTVPATDHKSVRIIGLAGTDGIDLCPHVATIEAWAWENGAQDVVPVGRIGWKKPLSKVGYEIDRVVYRKTKP